MVKFTLEDKLRRDNLNICQNFYNYYWLKFWLETWIAMATLCFGADKKLCRLGLRCGKCHVVRQSVM